MWGSVVTRTMALSCHKMELISNESLEDWKFLASGGFGHVYKARHKDYGFDVAIKILRDGVWSNSPFLQKALSDEASHMEKASCEFVLRLYGMYQGCLPIGRASVQQGIVMEFMERGSFQSLLNDLAGPPPWPLAFRLAHQVALGMNFLHSKNLVHQDLKPSNVLLNHDLNAKIADFGLCRISTSATCKRETGTENGGSYKYMPPEAFEVSYDPVRAYDLYSYGILLWVILAGKEPYPSASYSLVRIKIPEGQRPECNFDNIKAEGLQELADLMKRCWDPEPSKRHSFKECLKVTESVFSRHKKGVHDAVCQVLTQLESPASNQHSHTYGVSSSMVSSCLPHTPEQSIHDTVDHVRLAKPEHSAVQGCANDLSNGMNSKDKAKFVDGKRAALIQEVFLVMTIVDELGDMVHRETYSIIEAKDRNQEKMRALYQAILQPGGVKVKAAFYDSLKKHHPEIVEKLGG